MKYKLSLSIALLLCFSGSHPAYVNAQNTTDWQQITPTLRVGASLRARYESKQNFSFGAATRNNTQDWWLHQLRLNIRWQPSDNLMTFIEGQDARIHTATKSHQINNRSTPNIFEDHFDIHQAYVDFSMNNGDLNSRLRLGRQKLNLGAQRMVASLEWVNTARVWDGIRSTTTLGKAHEIDVFATRLVPVNPNKLNNHDTTGSRMFNSSFHGIYYTNKTFITGLQTELYGLLRHAPLSQDNIYTAGLRLVYTAGHWKSDAEFMAQTGSFGGLQHRAYAMHIGGGYHISALNTQLSVAYNFGSGDSNPNDNKHQTFDNMYPLNHAYYGFMDFFSLQNMHNTEVVAKSKLLPGLTLRTAWQNFWLAKANTDAWYDAGATPIRTASGSVSSHVGHEIDITLIYKIPDLNTKIIIGYDHFFTGNYIKQTGSSHDADFFYSQIKISI